MSIAVVVAAAVAVVVVAAAAAAAAAAGAAADDDDADVADAAGAAASESRTPTDREPEPSPNEHGGKKNIDLTSMKSSTNGVHRPFSSSAGSVPSFTGFLNPQSNPKPLSFSVVNHFLKKSLCIILYYFQGRSWFRSFCNTISIISYD